MTQPQAYIPMDSETSPACKLFFLCEDRVAQENALKLKNVLAANCQQHVMIEATFCNFARLGHPILKESLKRHASEADMIIVSATTPDGLPIFVQNWIKEFAPVKKPLACAHFCTTAPSAPRTFQFMEQWSRQAGAAYFSNARAGMLQ
jgi:hypothetical protein